MEDNKIIPIDQALQMAFNKIGQLSFQIDLMTQQIQALDAENKELREKLDHKKIKSVK